MGDAGHSDLDHAMQLVGQMLDAARAGDWSRVITLRPECDALLRQRHPADERTRMALQGLQLQHQSLSDLVVRARDEIALEIGRAAQTHRALSTYLDSSGVR